MIGVDRSRVTPWQAWLDQAEMATDRLAAAVSLGRDRVLEPKVYRDQSIRKLVVALFEGKCAYCESAIGETAGGHVDHFRPKELAIGLDGETMLGGYWWLAYTWENLYLACQHCNRNKGSRFPVAGPRATGPGDDLAAERALLLDPCADDPDQHLAFFEDGRVASRWVGSQEEDRGAITIDVLGLNRPGLVEARREAAVQLRARFAALGAGDAVDPQAPYVALQRQCLGELAARPRGVRGTRKPARASLLARQDKHEQDLRRASVEDNRDLESRQSQTIESLEIVNFRGIDRLRITCGFGDADGAGWTMLLGENGMGKSSVLQALALALMGAEEQQRLDEVDPRELLRQGAAEGRIRVWFAADAEPLEVTLTPDRVVFGEAAARPRMILLGFGSSRWLPRPGGFEPERGGYIRVRNLFNPFVPLADTLTWLAELDDEGFGKTADALLRLLDLGAHRLLRDGEGEVRVVADGAPEELAVPLRHLSDGYQSVLAIVGDIMELLSPKKLDMAAAEGLVLIDEIGAHLHPRWQMQVVGRLRQAFPHLQFVVTSHEPLCLRGLHDGEIVVLRRTSQGHVVPITELPSVAGLRVDQLLTSPHFGLMSTIDEEVEQRFLEYHALLAQEDLDAAEQARLAELREELGGQELLGSNRRDRAMLDAIDHYLAREVDDISARGEALLKEETRDVLTSILAELDEETTEGDG